MPRRILVVDDQESRAGEGRLGRRPALVPRLRNRKAGVYGDDELEARAALLKVVDVESPSVLFSDAPAGSQPETHASLVRFRGEASGE